MTNDSVSIRVDGQECRQIALQFPISNGNVGEPSVMILDNPDKPYALYDRHLVEISEDGQEWRRVSIIYLTTLLRSLPWEE